MGPRFGSQHSTLIGRAWGCCRVPWGALQPGTTGVAVRYHAHS